MYTLVYVQVYTSTQVVGNMKCRWSPVDDAEVSVVGQVAVVRSLPGDGGPRSTADFTSEGDTLTIVACDVTQWHKELWGN